MKKFLEKDIPNGTLLCFNLSIKYIALKCSNNLWIYFINGKNKLHFIESLYQNYQNYFDNSFDVYVDEDIMCGVFKRKSG